MSEENVEIARRSLDGWNRGDVDTWLASVHPEIEWFSAVARQVEGSETVYRGVAEMRRFWDEWHAVWDLAIEVSEFRDLGDTVVALGQIRVRGGASGIDMEGPVAYVFDFDEGLVRTARAYLDWADALEAAGLSE
jgi:ketosteroid isomerase-like protein